MGQDIEWHEGDMPYSTQFGDHFYSKSDGRAECAHVFLKGDNLPARWLEPDTFTIAELGFGTGLNFLETWRQWQVSGADGKLTFVSFERFPLEAEHIDRALRSWPILTHHSTALVSAWPKQPSGIITIAFDGSVTLEIHIGDAQQCVAAWSGKADAWFLDGFAPSRNEEMWSQQLMTDVFKHTTAHGTLATYSAAGWVRRNLQAAGFTVQKCPGHAGKRDMTIGNRA